MQRQSCNFWNSPAASDIRSGLLFLRLQYNLAIFDLRPRKQRTPPINLPLWQAWWMQRRSGWVLLSRWHEATASGRGLGRRLSSRPPVCGARVMLWPKVTGREAMLSLTRILHGKSQFAMGVRCGALKLPCSTSKRQRAGRKLIWRRFTRVSLLCKTEFVSSRALVRACARTSPVRLFGRFFCCLSSSRPVAFVTVWPACNDRLP